MSESRGSLDVKMITLLGSGVGDYLYNWICENLEGFLILDKFLNCHSGSRPMSTKSEIGLLVSASNWQ